MKRFIKKNNTVGELTALWLLSPGRNSVLGINLALREV